MQRLACEYVSNSVSSVAAMPESGSRCDSTQLRLNPRNPLCLPNPLGHHKEEDTHPLLSCTEQLSAALLSHTGQTKEQLDLHRKVRREEQNYRERHKIK